ncbi:glycoside hydrolase family 3 protein [Sphingomonas faeni]|uniref:glycoside hydrolase family 3 protein n=1 Tax=Sphingomonas faeni TaxID=185950 RepID=UPI0020C086B1|nr:glycoside hydrolase family 3 protein [Sphingomonas faeni]MCK8456633.1 glycoside hydrolase family 3 C-terminal domain-containing protein [Sphingomonas faeni]
MIRNALFAAPLAALLATSALAQTVDPAVRSMTLDEKAAQLQSVAPAIPRLNLPAYDYWNEGLHGLARNGVATVFPQAIGLAATWDEALLRRVGDVVSTEARAKSNALPAGDRARYQGLTIWSPNINIFRDPRWGRGQETYGEDPYLTGRLGVAFIGGLQGPDLAHPKVIATPKHLAAHSGPEAGRDGFDVDISPHDREATFLPAFRMALTEGKALSTMCAYNAIHGVPVCASKPLLTETVRNQWGFKGLIVSDCDAVGNIANYHYYRPDNASGSAAAISAGMDFNCGKTYAALGDAVRRGLVPEATIDASLTRTFAVRRMLGGAFGTTSPWDMIKATEFDTPAHRALALEAARKAMVLVQNNGVLPLKPSAKIAVIGPNADSVDVLEANYHGTAAAPITPLAALRTSFAGVRYAQGASIAEGVPVPVPDTALALRGEYFRGSDFAGTPVVRADRTIDFDWDRTAPASGIDPAAFSVRWTGTIIAPAAGDYVFRLDVPRCFDCKGHDPSRLWIDDKLVADDDGSGKNVEAAVTLAAGPHSIRVELAHSGEDQGLRLNWTAPAEAQVAEAVAAAKDADAIVAFVGLSPAVEGEALQIEVAGFSGGDRTDIGLPAAQVRLLEAAKATGKPLVVVLMTGSAVAMTWAKAHADAILVGWYPGQAGGQAIADTLVGKSNPGGRLPVTFYAKTRDLPAFIDYNMRERTYRYFTGTPLWGFGHGLSYTQFAYAAPKLARSTIAAGESFTVEVPVRNTGKLAGDEVVQAYLVPPEPAVKPRFNDPVLQRQLVGFRRATVKPGQTARVAFTIDPRGMSSVDAAGNRSVVPGEYRLHIGGGQPGDGPGVETVFTVTGSKDLPK